MAGVLLFFARAFPRAPLLLAVGWSIPATITLRGRVAHGHVFPDRNGVFAVIPQSWPRARSVARVNLKDKPGVPRAGTRCPHKDRRRMTRTAAVDWWNTSLGEVGVQGMEKLLAPDAGWAEVLQSGRDDLARAITATGMQAGRDRNVLDIGCGIGRMSFALAEQFGEVVGIDVAERLIEQAQAHAPGDGRVMFEVADGERIAPRSRREFDTVFSYEVLYIVPPATLAQYFADIAGLLVPGGEFIFQINCQPMRWTTRLSYRVRDVLFALGVKTWRGWPTGPGFRRYPYTTLWVRRNLERAGLELVRLGGPNLRQSWFVARKRV